MLSLLLWSLAGVLVTALLAVLSVLCAPMRITVMVDTQSRPAVRLVVALFSGLLPVFSSTDAQQGRSRKRLSRKRRRAKHRTRSAFAARALRELPALISKIIGRVKLEKVEATVRFGLPDPADTGIVYGALVPLLRFASASERSDIVLHPDFGNRVIDGQGCIGARVVPAAVVAPMLSFAWATMISPRLSDVLR